MVVQFSLGLAVAVTLAVALVVLPLVIVVAVLAVEVYITALLSDVLCLVDALVALTRDSATATTACTITTSLYRDVPRLHWT
jgi:hypothetical protein